jgi:hypothetical protein
VEVSALTAFLAPFLPHLVRLGQEAAEAAGAKLDADAWNFAKRLWQLLRSPVEARPEAEAAVMKRAAGVDNDAVMEDLRTELARMSDRWRSVGIGRPERQI